MSPPDPLTDFLAQRDIAVVGASRSPAKWGNVVYRDLRAKGYRVIPINPSADTIAGDRCFASLRDLPQKPGGVVIVTPPEVTETVASEITDLGIERAWLQEGAESPAVLDHLARHGVSVVHGLCVMVKSR